MTKEQIEQAASAYIETADIIESSGEGLAAFDAFLAGAEFRQTEIDELTADIERYKADIADGLKREEIARKVIEDKREEAQANARLIAAAPELLEALEMILPRLAATDGAGNHKAAVSIACKAIDKAKGI
jgi:hypothetical protein